MEWKHKLLLAIASLTEEQCKGFIAFLNEDNDNRSELNEFLDYVIKQENIKPDVKILFLNLISRYVKTH